jgi:murein L,D-transpeptidase YcbB/YkuD
MNRRVFLAGVSAVAATSRVARATAPELSPGERTTIAAALALDARAMAGLGDDALVRRLLEHARREAGQILRPAEIDKRWSLAPRPRDIAAEFEAARAAGRLAGWLTDLSPADPAYGALRVARVRYATMAAGGGWPASQADEPLRPGERDPEIARLRSRLAAEGYGAFPTSDPDVFDAGLEAALHVFQDAHALAVDGVVGPDTRRALDVTARQRLAQIDANLERWRWLPRPLPADRVEVDTGAQTAALFRAGAEVLRMRAIVGSPAHPTPMFQASIEAVVFNPPWNVPESIARNELLPAEARRPGLLASLGIRRVDGRLQQRPGPNNSLGQIKFDVPNRFGVYLHDTPGKGLFANPVRAFSHGCMRLEQPRLLAAALLAPRGLAEIDAWIAAGSTRRRALPAPVPLIVVHRTAHARPDGRVAFHPDIYGWDARVARRLAEA